MRTHRAEILLGYGLELLASALRGARVALGCMIGDGDDENVRPPAASDDAVFDHGVGDTPAHAGASGSQTTRDPEALRRALATVPPLPTSYGDDRLVLLARDPGTLFAYWDLAPGFDHPAGARVARLVLRIEDLTLLDFQAARPWQHHDFEIEGLVGSRYVEVAHSAGTYRAQVGWRAVDGSFASRVQSSIVTTPRADTPGHEPLRWMTVRVDGGPGRAAPDAPARLAAEEAAAPRGVLDAATTDIAARTASQSLYGRPTSAAPHDAPSSADLHRRVPNAAELNRRAPSSAELHGHAPSSADLHRRGR